MSAAMRMISIVVVSMLDSLRRNYSMQCGELSHHFSDSRWAQFKANGTRLPGDVSGLRPDVGFLKSAAAVVKFHVRQKQNYRLESGNTEKIARMLRSIFMEHILS